MGVEGGAEAPGSTTKEMMKMTALVLALVLTFAGFTAARVERQQEVAVVQVKA